MAVNRETWALVLKHKGKKTTILDVGSALDSSQQGRLRQEGHAVTPIQNLMGTTKRYDLVLASGWLNQRRTKGDMDRAFKLLKGAIEPGGTVITDYPPPRGPIETIRIRLIAQAHFRSVQQVGPPSSPAWLLRSPT